VATLIPLPRCLSGDAELCSDFGPADAEERWAERITMRTAILW
jgi:hypothetical protein